VFRLPPAPTPLRYAGVLACAAVILSVSTAEPGEGDPRTLFGLGISVYLHFVAYGGLAGAIGYAALAADRRALLLAAGLSFAYGVGIELIQWPIAYRTASILDAGINAAGAAIGAAVWRVVAPVFGADAPAADGSRP